MALLKEGPEKGRWARASAPEDVGYEHFLQGSQDSVSAEGNRDPPPRTAWLQRWVLICHSGRDRHVRPVEPLGLRLTRKGRKHKSDVRFCCQGCGILDADDLVDEPAASLVSGQERLHPEYGLQGTRE